MSVQKKSHNSEMIQIPSDQFDNSRRTEVTFAMSQDKERLILIFGEAVKYFPFSKDNLQNFIEVLQRAYADMNQSIDFEKN